MRYWLFISAILILGFVLGCALLLPSNESVATSKWATYEAAVTNFACIIPYTTTVTQLKAMGYDPFATPNIRVLTHLDVQQRFLTNPSVRREDLPASILACLSAAGGCMAYEVDMRVTRSRRNGNFLLDVTSFCRQTHETGWSFKALIVISDQLVVYKLWSGLPSLDAQHKSVKPLGPLQEVDAMLRSALPTSR
jgi:hypothetical protein